MTTRIAKGKKVTAMIVAEYFLKRAKEERKPITNKKLQKLVYYSQVWHLVFFKDPLFKEKIEAWVHGPAVPALYGRFKRFEFNPIDVEVKDEDLKILSTEQTELLENIWSVYGKYDADYLEVLTHSELPWQEARRGLEGGQASRNEIDLVLAKKFYVGKLAENR